MSVSQGLESAEVLGQLEIVVHEQGTTITIELAGEWDLAGVPAVRPRIEHALSARPERVVLDLSRLAFMDSSGLHATIELAHRLAAQNIALAIVPGSPAIQRLFDITGLTERLVFIPRATGSPPAPSGASRSHGFIGKEASIPTKSAPAES